MKKKSRPRKPVVLVLGEYTFVMTCEMARKLSRKLAIAGETTSDVWVIDERVGSALEIEEKVR